MHVAFFNRSYYPDATATGQLLTDLCEDLVRLHGCRVTVVTGLPLAPSPGSRPVTAGREVVNGVEVHRTIGTTFDKRRFAGRASNYVTYFMSACWKGLRIDRPDVVVALTDPPIIGLAAWLSGRKYHAPFVMSYRDLFPEVTVLLDDFHSRTLDAMLQQVNRFLCRTASRVIALGDTMRERLITNKGASPARTLIIPDWADTTAIVPGPKDNAFAAAHGLTNKFVVMHSGNIGLSQGLETVIEAAAILNDVADLQVVFQGDGVKKPVLQEMVGTLGLSNVTFLPFQPKERLGESFASADVFIVSLQRDLVGYIVPSKLYGILAAGRPFVAAVAENCEVASIARRDDCGLVAEPASPKDLADKIMTYYRDRALMVRCGRHARRAGLKYDRTLQVSRYMELFRELRPVPAAAYPLGSKDVHVARG
ncbi:MAG: glycosyltransferase family 4 protein [Acidobacteriota bacterium]